uniref:DUF3778 domain-containing protein n=1 Tax=Oryza meridionalis TaxID=40149 RepID=A0A0E0DSD8_9ORYZ
MKVSGATYLFLITILWRTVNMTISNLHQYKKITFTSKQSGGQVVLLVRGPCAAGHCPVMSCPRQECWPAASAWRGLVVVENLRSLVCCHTGWHSTWSTAGGTRATASRSSSFLLEKLLTPMARALPESWSFSIAAHVAGISVGRTFCPPKPAPFFILTGQWI